MYVAVNPAWPAYVKIGLTRCNPAARLANFNTADPFKAFSFATVVAVDDAKVAERLLHETLDHCRVTGEWFHLNTEAAVRMVRSLRHRREA